MMRRQWLPALVLIVAWLAYPQPAHACPMCKEAVESNPRLAGMYNWSILILVSLPFILAGTIAVRTARTLDPTAYAELKRRLREFLWPKGWLGLAAGGLGLALLTWLTAPPSPAARLRLPAAELEAAPAAASAPLLLPLGGRVVVITYFASWCPPCLEQLADLSGLQPELAGGGLAVIAVNAFEDDATPAGVPHLHADGTIEFHTGAPDLVSFLETNALTMPVVTETPALSAALGGVTRLPTTFVFDPDGRLVARYVNEPRGSFVRPALPDLQRAIAGAAACRLSSRPLREGCVFLHAGGLGILGN